MGGNSRQKSSSSFSVFSFFKLKGHQKGKYIMEESPNVRKIWPSDEDRARWVAEPGIDKKASAFIDKFHRDRIAAAN